MAAKTRAELQAEIDVMRNETARGGNTRQRHATALQDVVDSAVVHADAMDLRILFIGDSHTDGVVHAATVTGTEGVGPTALASPLDEMWTPTGVAPFCRADSSMTRYTEVPPHTRTDGNLGATQYGSWVVWVPQLLRQAFPTRFARIRYCNIGCGGASSYSWSGNTATAYFGVAAVANAGDTITVNGRVYTFRVAPAAVDDIKIGATVLEQAQLIANAMNANGTAGAYGAGTTINADLFVSNTPTNWLVSLTARAVGAAGNAIVMSSSAGAATRVYIYQQFSNGDPYSNLLYNGQTDLAVSGGFGVPDVVVIYLGTNDAIRKGHLGIGYQAHMQALINRLHADYPAAKLLVWKPPPMSTPSQQAVLDATIWPAVDALGVANAGFVTVVPAHLLINGADATTQTVSADGLHLTVLGYQYVAQLTAKAIGAALGLM